MYRLSRLEILTTQAFVFQRNGILMLIITNLPLNLKYRPVLLITLMPILNTIR